MSELLAFKRNKDELQASFVSSQIHLTDTKNKIQSSSIEDEKLKKTFNDILHTCYSSDCKGEPTTKGVSKVIGRYIYFADGERDEMDNKIVKTFSTKEDVKEIYRYEKKEKEYWIIVADTYSKEVDDIYEMYFYLLDEECDYFEMRIISEDELSSFLYMEPKKIYGGL